ncbi:hypothetical protein FHW37_115119 [Neorhizobium alkalisoli]|uniref:MAPEG family protein n=1 Tax=Neorhizobium alkalisoli TaxID=528178 RepID=A0A561Q7T4_9HYPH|nr:hypothetical protein FHW37_115119 [Neorhizobium alkalisoli]
MFGFHIDPTFYMLLLVAWLVASAFNWYMIERVINKVGAKRPYFERVGIGFPFVQTGHPACPQELKDVYKVCMRWIYIPFGLLVALAIASG